MGRNYVLKYARVKPREELSDMSWRFDQLCRAAEQQAWDKLAQRIQELRGKP